jgi:glucose-6-phosphate 1-dehydrogenase
VSLNQTQNDKAPPAPPCVMVIFGAGGDLTRRKLIPSLFHLSNEGLLPENFAVVGVDRVDLGPDAFRDRLSDQIREHVGPIFSQVIWDSLVQRVHYMHGDFKDTRTYGQLCDLLQTVDEDHDTRGNRLFYLAVPPSLFAEITRQLATANLTQETPDKWRRVIIEKPFGSDLESAKALNRDLHEALDEDQIYRIDHYLGKETVQNIMVFRFANGFIEPM